MRVSSSSSFPSGSTVFAIALAVVIQTPVYAAPNINSPDQVPFKFGLGQQKYEAMCAKCHGPWLGGTDQGPPLLHGYYKPSHHGDQAFYRAILRGSPQHHWNFGDMPPVPGATPEDAQQIIPFVRWVQQAEGLF